MQDDRNDDEPIIATRRARDQPRDEAQPLWCLVLALSAGLAVVALLAWWLLGRPSRDDAPAAQSHSSMPTPQEAGPEEHIEQPPVLPAHDFDSNAHEPAPASPAPIAEPPPGVAQPSIPESIPEVPPDNADQTPAPPAPVSVRFMSPDAQVQIELRDPLASSPPIRSKSGEVIDVAPGTYRVVASGAGLESFEQEVTLDGERPLEYTIELCAEPKREHENLAGRIVEERACASTAQCESMFMVLSEHADQLVKDRAFRTQQCAKWRANAAPDGSWTLDIRCGGATLATTCQIEIAAGACTFAAPPRSTRGTACPRAELK